MILWAERARRDLLEIGDFIAEELPPLDFGRIAAQSAKQVIVQKVREAERERQYEEYNSQYATEQNKQMPDFLLFLRFILNALEKLQVCKVYFLIAPEIEQVNDYGYGNSQ